MATGMSSRDIGGMARPMSGFTGWRMAYRIGSSSKVMCVTMPRRPKWPAAARRCAGSEMVRWVPLASTYSTART